MILFILFNILKYNEKLFKYFAVAWKLQETTELQTIGAQTLSQHDLTQFIADCREIVQKSDFRHVCLP